MLLHLPSTWILQTQTYILILAQQAFNPVGHPLRPQIWQVNWFIIKVCYCGFGTVHFRIRIAMLLQMIHGSMSPERALHFFYLPWPWPCCAFISLPHLSGGLLKKKKKETE